MSAEVHRLQLLGAPAVEIAGRPLVLAVRKAWALLALLALDGSVTRARLAGLLWPEVDEAAARRNLRRELHRLRSAGLGALVDGDDTVLRLGGCDCDVHAYRHALEAGQATEALRLYRGPLLQGLEMDGETLAAWLAHQREQLHSRWQQAARAHAQALQAAGDLRGALATALQVLDVDALQEADYRTAMQLHDRLGNRESALALYERCRRALGKELGLRPMADTSALAERIRRGDSAPAAGPPPARADATLLAQAPLVGREGAWAELTALVHQPGLAFVALAGPAGVGKTRLAREFALAQGGLRLYGTRPGDAWVAFAAPLRWLREMGASAATLPRPLHRELSRVLPELGFEGPPPDPASPRDRLFDALAQAWRALCPPGAAMWVFDDLQWLDAAGLDWLFYLLAGQPRPDAGAPCALCLLRGEELGDTAAARLRALTGAGAAKLLTLAPLADADTLALVRKLSGSPQGERFARRLHQATAGHPLFLLETLRHLLDTGWLRVDAQGQWNTPVDDTTADYAELPVPASVRDAILARVERLGEAPRRLMEAASCLRRPVRFELIARATALSEWEAVSAFERLRAAQLMDADAAGQHRFTHDLIAQTLADALSPERRRLLHRTLAQTLAQAQDPEGLAADIAQHWLDGGEPGLAAPWWARAALQAEALGAPEEACAHVELALQAPGEPAAEVALHLQLARLRARLADTEGRLLAIACAEEAARASGQAELMAQAKLQRISAIGASDPAQARAGLDEVLAQAQLPHGLRSAAYQQSAVLKRQRGDIEGCVADFDHALALLPPGRLPLRVELMLMRAIALKFGGHMHAAEEGLRQTVDAARSCGSDAVHVRGLCVLASILADGGDAAASRQLCEDALAIAQRTHDVGLQRNAYLNLLRALVAQGELAVAMARVQEAMDLSPRFTSVSEEQALTEARFTLALMAGELGHALDAAPALLALSRRAAELWRSVSGLLAPVDAWLLLDSQHAEAEALVAEAEQRVADSGIDLMRLAVVVRRAELTLAAGDAAAALALITPALADPALRSQDLAHAQRIGALARHALGEPATLVAPTPKMNPEPATLIAAARLRIDPRTVDEALAWFNGGRATPLEALHLALALRDALPKARRADHQRLAAAARALASRLHDSLAAHPAAQMHFERQFAPLL